MTDPFVLIEAARKSGFSLRAAGEALYVSPRDRLRPDQEALIRERKADLIDALRAEAAIDQTAAALEDAARAYALSTQAAQAATAEGNQAVARDHHREAARIRAGALDAAARRLCALLRDAPAATVLLGGKFFKLEGGLAWALPLQVAVLCGAGAQVHAGELRRWTGRPRREVEHVCEALVAQGVLARDGRWFEAV